MKALPFVLPLSVLVLAAALQPQKITPSRGLSLAAVGLAEGSSAPPFRARDQLGKEQTQATVAGKNGTVLLFFRSADW